LAATRRDDGSNTIFKKRASMVREGGRERHERRAIEVPRKNMTTLSKERGIRRDKFFVPKEKWRMFEKKKKARKVERGLNLGRS